MPVSETVESGSVWATDGRFLMQLQGHRGGGEGAIPGASGHPTESLGYSLGNVRSPTEVAVPRLHLDVVFAAEQDIHTLRPVLTLSARTRHSLINGARHALV